MSKTRRRVRQTAKDKSKPIHYQETTYGFEFGSAKVERIFSDKAKGWIVIGIETPKHPKHSFQVYITKTGKIRIFDKDGEWFSLRSPK